jgi:hypothetical protein
MELLNNKETTSSSAATSTLKILTVAYEIPSVSTLERNPFRCVENEMPEHEKLCDSKDCQDRCDKVATRRMDGPDDHVSQRVDPLPPLSGTKDTGRQQPAT